MNKTLKVFVIYVCALTLLTHQTSRAAEPVPERIISFHQGKANKDLIRKAAELGFNGVQFQLEHGNIDPLLEFARRDNKQQYLSLCRSLGMKVSLWIREPADIPSGIGTPALNNKAMWALLSERYEWILGGLFPDIDALVLTVSEQYEGINMNNPEGIKKLIEPIYQKCKKYDKKLLIRTFLFRPEQLKKTKACFDVLPDDIIVMSKVIPLDWHLRGIGNPIIGKMGKSSHYIEFDLCGEYFKLTYPALTFPEKIKRDLDFGRSRDITGICARVDRFEHNILGNTQEMNLWTLGMLASGKTDSLDEIWKAYTTETFGPKAAQHMEKILRPTEQILTEAFCIGPFTFGNTRSNIPPVNMNSSDALNANAFANLWSNWIWDWSYYPQYLEIRDAHKEIIEKEQRANLDAIAASQKSLADLDAIQEMLSPLAYTSLKKHLIVNQQLIQTMHHIQMAYLKLKRYELTSNHRYRKKLKQDIDHHLKTLNTIAHKSGDEFTVLVDIRQWLNNFDQEYQKRIRK